MTRRLYDAVVLGGGLYGCNVALHLRRSGAAVLLVEAEQQLLRRASYNNQARVHGGCHYPRSLLTALRSRANYARFVQEYKAAIDTTFTACYAVARHYSKVSASQFRLFCQRIGAPLRPAPSGVRRLFDERLVEDVFLTEEAAFDATALREQLTAALAAAGVHVRIGCTAGPVHPDVPAVVTLRDHAGVEEVAARRIFNCTYAALNALRGADAECLPLVHEWTEIALVEAPAALRQLGLTIVDGPFFSIMPFPARGLHSLSHVRYTPHGTWKAEPTAPGGVANSGRHASNYAAMVRDAKRYVPILAECVYVDSLWETKTVLAASARDDSRPILFDQDPRARGVTSILGGKIDNIYDVLTAIDGTANARVHA